MRRITLSAVLVALGVNGVMAQELKQAFEVASIRPCRPQESPEQFMQIMVATPDTGIRYYKPCLPVEALVTFAYNVPSSRLRNSPVWTRVEWFRVEAIAAAPVDLDEMRLLVRQLLADRFAFKSHTEVVTLRRYTLVLARPDRSLGPNVKPAAVDCAAFPSGVPEAGWVQRGKDGFPVCGVSGGTRDGVITRAYRGMTMQKFAQSLQGFQGEVVVDGTGIDGLFDFSIAHTVEDQNGLAVRGDAGFIQAIERQLGLKLERGEGPVEVLVIDSVQQPTEN